MGEINGQLFGVLLVIGIFGIVSAAITVTVTNLSNSIEEKANEVIENETLTKNYRFSYELQSR